jgi:hypothetical protein
MQHIGEHGAQLHIRCCRRLHTLPPLPHPHLGRSARKSHVVWWHGEGDKKVVEVLEVVLGEHDNLGTEVEDACARVVNDVVRHRLGKLEVGVLGMRHLRVHQEDTSLTEEDVPNE